MKKSLFTILCMLLLGTWRAIAQPGFNPEIQSIAEEELASAIIGSNADWGAAIVMDINSGQVVATANLKRGKDGKCAQGDNYALQAFEPGGLMMPVSMMAAMRRGWAYPLDQQLAIGQSYSFDDSCPPIRDTHSPSSLPVNRLLEYGSNIGIAKLIAPHYNNSIEFMRDLDSLGLFANLGFADEEAPSFPVHNTKSGIARQAFGYASSISPVRLCSIYNSAARGDILTPEQTADFLDMLHAVVYGEAGTAKAMRDDAIDIAGKTGTAFIFDSGKRKYTDGKRLSFCGVFPYDSPRYTCLVVISNPKENIGAARSAGAATMGIAKRLAAQRK